MLIIPAILVMFWVKVSSFPLINSGADNISSRQCLKRNDRRHFSFWMTKVKFSGVFWQRVPVVLVVWFVITSISSPSLVSSRVQDVLGPSPFCRVCSQLIFLSLSHRGKHWRWNMNDITWVTCALSLWSLEVGVQTYSPVCQAAGLCLTSHSA